MKIIQHHFLVVQFSFDCSYSCAQSLSIAESRASACALILCTIPGCQRKGQAYSQGYTHCGQKGSDGLGSSSAVRTGPRGPGPLLQIKTIWESPSDKASDPGDVLKNINEHIERFRSQGQHCASKLLVIL